jgi:synaptobrevin family protein YKT6
MDERPEENRSDAIRLAFATKLDVGYFVRGKVEEFLKFGSRTVAARISLGSRQVVSLSTEQMYQCYAYRRSDGLCCVAITDKDYPQFTAFQVCNKVLAEFEAEHKDWTREEKDCDRGKQAPWLVTLIERFQKPEEADKLLAVQKKLDEIKEIMYANIEKVLERGENLEVLAAKAQDLSDSSKLFLRDTQKMNSCCHRYFGV